jgi:hypothetical protein
MKLLFGTSPQIFKRDFLLYFSVQTAIFAKVILFYFYFGHGLSYYGQPLALDVPFIALPVFGNLLHVWDYFFHQTMHVLIALWVFLLARNLQKFLFHELAFLFLVATFMHNVGYWLTASHPSWLYSVQDYIIDYFSLWGFFLLFWLVIKLVPSLRKIRIPYFDG